MKVQCPSCREIVEMSDFSTSEAGLRFTCPNCRVENFLINPAAPGSPGPASAPETDRYTASPPPADQEIVCPKCGHAQTDPQACHRCGLMFEKYDPAKLPPDPSEPASLWEQILKRPDDDELHQNFIAACLSADRLDYATRQYRMWSREPGRRELAERMLDRVARKGQSQVAPVNLTSAPRDDSKGLVKLVVWVVVGLGLGLLFYYILKASNMVNRSWP